MVCQLRYNELVPEDEPTGDVNFENFESIFVHIKAVKDAFFCAGKIASCGCNYRQIRRF